jgi:hypothetical protein
MQALVDDMNAKVAEIKLGMFMDPLSFLLTELFILTSQGQLWGNVGKIEPWAPCSEPLIALFLTFFSSPIHVCNF